MKNISANTYTSLSERFCAAGLLAVCPLLFFTRLTVNPFIVQARILYALLAVAAMRVLWRMWKGEKQAVHVQPFDKWLLGYVAAGFVGWVCYFAAASSPWKLTSFCALLEQGSLFFIVAVGGYLWGKYLPWGKEDDGLFWWPIGCAAWGMGWILFPLIKHFSAVGATVYGCILWAVGIAWLIRLFSALTQQKALALLMGVMTIAVGYGLLQSWGVELFWPESVRAFSALAFSTFGNPNFLASAVVLLLPLSGYCFLAAKSRWHQGVYGCCVFLYVCYLTVSVTRSAWIGAAVALVSAGCFSAVRKWLVTRKWQLVVLGGIVAFGISAACVSRHNLDTVKAAVQETQKAVPTFSLRVQHQQIYPSLHQRLLMWKVAARMFKHHPLFGVGWGNFQAAFVQEQAAVLAEYPELRELKAFTNAPHNEIFLQLAQGGIVGLLLFAGMWWAFISSVRRLAKTKKEETRKYILLALACGMSGVFADNLLNISLQTPVVCFLFWSMAGMVLCGTNTEKKQNGFVLPQKMRFTSIIGIILAGTVIVWQGAWLYSEMRALRGQIDVVRKQYPQAINHLTAALRSYPINIEAGFRLGNIYLAQKRGKEALAVFDRTSRYAADHMEIYHQAAVAAAQIADMPTTADNFRRFLLLDPYQVTAYGSFLAARAAAPEKAVPEEDMLVERAVRFFPYRSDFWELAGYIYARQDRKDKTQQLYEQGLAVNPFDENLYQAVSLLYKEKMLPLLLMQTAALRRYHKDLNAWSTLPSANREALQKELEQYVQTYPQDMNGQILLARLLAEKQEWEQSKQTLRRVLQQQPENIWAWLALSSVFYKTNDARLAKEALQNVLFYAPENRLARERLARLKF